MRVGGYHHASCDVEECPTCHGQAFVCEHSVIEQPWDGGDYRLADVVDLTGAKRSQIENWARNGWLIPERGTSSGTGDHRLFSFRNLIDVAIGVRLSRFHIPIRTLLRDVGMSTLRELVPEGSSHSNTLTDEQLVEWYTEGWTESDWDENRTPSDGGEPLTKSEYIATIIARHRSMAQHWQDFINPSRRPQGAYQAIQINSDGSKYSVSWLQEGGQVHDCALVINLATIFDDLEVATRDEWGREAK